MKTVVLIHACDLADWRLQQQTSMTQHLHLKHLMDDARLCVCVVDTGGGGFGWALVNAGFMRVSGIARPEDVVGQTLESVLTPLVGQAEAEALRQIFRECIEAAIPRDIQRRFVSRGQERFYHIHLTPVPDQQGQVSQLVLIGVDITELSTAESRFHRQYELLEDIARSANTAYASIRVIDGRHLRVEQVNNYWLTLTGHTESDVVGKSPEEMVPGIPLQAARQMTSRYLECVETGRSFSYEEVVPIKGVDVSWHTTLIPVHDAHGAVYRIIVNSINLDPLKAAERKLKSALEEVTLLKNQLQAENSYLRDEVRQAQGFEDIIGTSDKLRHCLDLVQKVAPLETTVLIMGETGTGKELVAHMLHRQSARRNGPLVSVNCAALPHELIESELFGHEKGAFTGAFESRQGRLELAGEGTLFLDEIGELDINMQTRLLRVLENGTYQRVGGNTDRVLKARVIAATNRDLERAIELGLFRRDLYYRINRFPIQVPPLRDRGNDVFLLAAHYARHYGTAMKRKYNGFTRELQLYLDSHKFPGNVRELQNLIERSMIVSRGFLLELPTEFLHSGVLDTPPQEPDERLEREQLQQTLERCQWRIEGPTGAARELRLTPSTLRYRLRKLGLRRPRGRERQTAPQALPRKDA